MTRRAKILLVDDHSVVTWGIKSLIERNTDHIVCGEAQNLYDAYELVEDLMPELVLLDIKLPDGDGVAGLRRIKKISPATKVIMLTAYAEEDIVQETLKAGANGYLLKNIDSKTILKAINDVLSGKMVVDKSVDKKHISDNSFVNKHENILTQQELKILQLVATGKSNKDIAEECFLAEKTVRNYVSKILSKINVSNRTEAALYWKRKKSLD
ncbi:response regulator transcription factor [Alkalicella caledoniensis]|uniref:Stage 0 sporulation protein A homolog n=1 Tax=Alkalicella caledoniensis TaxID=2731377 RepID=A0A7G9W5J6_ALKCA|nr:response regulator transcription factor [Alkalicella caledoniensis]QNO13958.1 response regulator transcription factor [Alkalicella caledoniensis]